MGMHQHYNGTPTPDHPRQLWSEQGQGTTPLTPVNGDVLLTRLLLCFQTFHGETRGMVDRICQVVVEASQGQVFLHLSQRQPAQELSPRSSLYHLAPVRMAGRVYGSLAVLPDHIELRQAALSFEVARNLAQCCALFFYNLEMTVLLGGIPPSLPSQPTPLSKREQEILEWLCRGHDRKTIADSLHIAPTTLSKHFEHIYQQIGAHSVRDARLVAFVLGLYYPLEELRPTIDRAFHT